jgi:uncharacterized membrane protein SpoIIM required for sporulation
MISAVTENAFAARRQGDWSTLEQLAHRVDTKGYKGLSPSDLARISPLYRDVCADLARAEAARYSAPLVDYLQSLTASAHTVLYGVYGRRGRGGPRFRGMKSALEAFPRAVRAHYRSMLLSALFFFGPFAVGVLVALYEPGFAFRIVPEATLLPLTEAYAKGFDSGRDAGESALMAGFYVNNNIGIALRCFALGIFGGLGSAFYLIDNGLSIGAILGYVASQGAGTNILTFIVSHGSLELGAIVLSGGAGLSLGWSIVSPGDRTRLASLQAAGRDVAVIAFGAAVMLLLAAGIEGFWSGSSVPSWLKRSVGGTLFLAVMSYLVLAGRGASRSPGDRSAIESGAAPWT